MKLETYLFGTVDVQPETVIEFPQGLAGFDNLRKFLLIHEASAGEVPASFTLQSAEDPSVAFQIIDPTVLGFEYELELTDQETAMLQIGTNGTEADVAVMLTLFKQGADSAAVNAAIRAPLILNTKARVGMQKVIERARPNLMISNLSSGV
jgi:flagellar assembly factor FliW